MHQNSYFQLKVYLFEMFEFVFVGRTLACPWDGGGRALEHVPGTRVTANGDRIRMELGMTYPAARSEPARSAAIHTWGDGAPGDSYDVSFSIECACMPLECVFAFRNSYCSLCVLGTNRLHVPECLNLHEI